MARRPTSNDCVPDIVSPIAAENFAGSRRTVYCSTLYELVPVSPPMTLPIVVSIFLPVDMVSSTETIGSMAGTIGFVGIVAPHLVRARVGHDPARSLLPSALLAGLFLVVADIGVRVLPTDSELKLGVVAALVGAPLFVLIAARRRTGA